MNLGNLASKVGGLAKETARNSLVSGLLNVTGQGSLLGGKKPLVDLEKLIGNEDDGNTSEFSGLFTNGTKERPGNDDMQALMNHPIKYPINTDDVKVSEEAATGIMSNTKSGEENMAAGKSKDEKRTYRGLLYDDVTTKYDKVSSEDPLSDTIKLKLPDWSYGDFINERAIWQKGLSSILDEPAWFYFKLFFNFDTNHGLFGGLLNLKDMRYSVNSAAKYLYSIRNTHKYIKPKDRINALYKFTSILSYINSNAPWYFKSIKGLDTIANPIVDNFSEQRTITLDVAPDAIDMRLSTIMSLYNYACYDNINHKEIIPSNLRKFNMSIVLFQAPLRYLHTSYMTTEKKEFMGINLTGIKNEVTSLFGKRNNNNSSIIKYKNMSPTNGNTMNYADTMSMKIYTLYGCEFDKDSFNTIIPSNINNEKPFQFGNTSIKIKYLTSTEHTMNEFYGMLFGTDGFYFNQYSNFQLDNIDGLINPQENWKEKQVQRYKDLVSTLTDERNGEKILGLIDKPQSYKNAIDATEAIMNGMFDNPNLLKGIATNFALGLLGSSLSTHAPQGNIYGDYGIGSAYYKDKLEMLKNGVHERTTAPYYYDPNTGARIDLHKNKNYSAYTMKNIGTDVTNFNVTNWLETNTQKAASSINNALRF